MWLEKRGKKLKFKTEPQDSVDFTLKCTQDFLKRLIQNESSIGDQVEDRRKQLELADRLEQNGQLVNVVAEEEEAMKEITYEDEFDGDEIDDDDALN